MLDDTLKKFGYPASLVKEYRDWYLLLRPEQVTIGALVLVAKSGAKNFSDVEPAGFNELNKVIKEIESVLAGCFGYDKINYLMLMMVDPEVHFHIVPRYQNQIEFAGTTFRDADWPGMPSMQYINDASQDVLDKITRHIKKRLSVQEASE